MGQYVAASLRTYADRLVKSRGLNSGRRLKSAAFASYLLSYAHMPVGLHPRGSQNPFVLFAGQKCFASCEISHLLKLPGLFLLLLFIFFFAKAAAHIKRGAAPDGRPAIRHRLNQFRSSLNLELHSQRCRLSSSWPGAVMTHRGGEARCPLRSGDIDT